MATNSNASNDSRAAAAADMPPAAVLLQMIHAKFVSMAICSAARFDIAERLASGPKSVGELAELSGTDPKALYRLLRATASVGIFSELPDGRFAQTPLSEPLRIDAKPSIKHFALMLLDEWHYRSWGELPGCVRSGRAAPHRLFGGNMFEWLAQRPEQAENFNAAMADLSRREGFAVARAYDFSRFRHVMDVGGGLGTLLGAILKRAPELQATLFDLPRVIEQARAAAVLAPFADRCVFAGGSFFEDIPSGADAYIMKYVIHDWDDDQCRRILGMVRKAMPSGGTLLVVEHVIPPGNEPAMSKISDIEMLVLNDGRERTEAELRELFLRSGFRLNRIVRSGAAPSILECTPD